MSSLNELEELRQSLDQVVARAETMRLSDFTYLLRMAVLEITHQQQIEMDRLEGINSLQSNQSVALPYQRY